MKKTKVGVIFGGVSVEHEVSIISGLQAFHALDTERYNGIPIYISKAGLWYIGKGLSEIGNFSDTASLLGKSVNVLPSGQNGQLVLLNANPTLFGRKPVESIDIVFPVLHGTNGEDGTLQGMLELFNIPYAGCDVLSSAIGMNKILFKSFLKGNDIPAVDYVELSMENWLLHRNDCVNKIESRLGYPVIVKPSNLGSSIGISAVNNISELENAIVNAGQYSRSILIERLVQNLRELNCSVLGNGDSTVVSVIEEPIRNSNILSFSDKYEGGKTKGMASTSRILPAQIPEPLKIKIERLSKQVFTLLGAGGVARIDFLMNKETEDLYVNEINTIPGSLSFYLWEKSGISFTELTSQMLKIALDRHRNKAKNIYVFDSNILSLRASNGKIGSKR
ncbi:MAG: D-alanine--D-alanine ligase [Nitrospirae bacterium]|uniref:D-alanine--D-alanine ligase family protein n=1 Tax=Candidatus Magnetobacterium casense TaxID=1455061 RepID=UPI0005909974|nr:D-alanine--D-alanine ligase family protein [Candidatus Magnetobacterium casensis]MBF0336796.1 D-alanine--D-alanine ligase [Nitrospirota bacterium]